MQKIHTQFYNYITRLFVLKETHPERQAIEINEIVQNMLKSQVTLDNIKAMLNQPVEFDLIENIRQLKLYKETKSRYMMSKTDDAELIKAKNEQVQLSQIIKELRQTQEVNFKELCTQKQELADLRASNEELLQTHQQFTLLQQENQQLRDQLLQQKDKLASYSKSSQDLRKQMESFEQIQSELENANSNIQETLELKKQTDSEKAKMAVQIQQLQSQIAKLKQDSQQSGEKQAKQDLSALQQAKDSNILLVKKTKALTQQLEDQNAFIDKLQQENKQNQTTIQQLQQQNELLASAPSQQPAAQNDAELQALRAENGNLAAQASTMQHKAEEAEKRLQELSEQIKQDEEQSRQQKREIIDLSGKISSLKDVIGVLEEQLSESKQALNAKIV